MFYDWATGRGRISTRRAFLAGGAGVLGAAALPACAPGRPAAAPGARPTASAAAQASSNELFAHVVDQSKSVTPIGPEERAERRARLKRILASSGGAALMLEGGATMTYLSGVSWWRSERLFALVMPSEGSHFWICPAFEEGRARSIIDAADGPGGDFVLWQEHEYPYAALEKALRERRIEKLLIEPQLRFMFAERLAERFGRERLASGHATVTALRSKKDAHEVALLRRASELTQYAIVETAKTLTPGLTGGDIGARVDRVHERLGMRAPWSVCLIGAAAAQPHGKGREGRLARGDVLLMDVGASLHGYQSDITRTFVFDGVPTAEIERAWNAVRDAQRRAFDLTRPTTPCRSVDAGARALLATLGFGEGYEKFTHRLGHGIGLETHEDPYFDGGSDVLLEPGMTLTDEPGIYLPGHFGVRIEDVLLVTANGAEHFGQWQATPRWPG
ncbi:MAG TPA: Xaa-Pro peptidase family protein [Polyangiaceae bacterium]|nr:Xaa-Pro peptidase family protein [Polyangiaceae bacterium]